MRVEKYYDKLKEAGHKITTQRKVVLAVMVEHKDEHLTVEQIYHYVKQTNPEIGLATVYRNVQLLSDMKILDKLNLDDGYIRYELEKEDEVHHHHHLICNDCDKVIEVTEDLLDSIEDSFKKKYGFTVTDHHAKFYGLCKDCADKK